MGTSFNPIEACKRQNEFKFPQVSPRWTWKTTIPERRFFLSIEYISDPVLTSGLWKSVALRIHVWYIHLHLVDFYGKCRDVYHTWILWVESQSYYSTCFQPNFTTNNVKSYHFVHFCLTTSNLMFSPHGCLCRQTFSPPESKRASWLQCNRSSSDVHQDLQSMVGGCKGQVSNTISSQQNHEEPQ